MTQEDSHGASSCENDDRSLKGVGHSGGMESKHVSHMSLSEYDEHIRFCEKIDKLL